MHELVKNLPVRYKLGLLLLAFIVAFAVGSLALYRTVRSSLTHQIDSDLERSTRLITSLVEISADVSIRNYLRAVAEQNIHMLESLRQKVREGRLTEAEAKKRARDILVSKHIGRTGYIYCLNSNGDVTVHPNLGVEGANVLDREFVRRQVEEKSGYIEYNWKNPDESEVRHKALYMAYFKPWDWIVSASTYRDEFSELISLDDFRERLLSVRLGESGYPFIIDEHGKILIHPHLSGNILTENEGAFLYRHFMANRHGQIAYAWMNPGETAPREKIARFDYLPEYGWFVSSSGYVDELYAPLRQLLRFVLLAAGVSLAAAVPLLFSIGRSISHPLRELTRGLSESAAGVSLRRVEWSSFDEFGVLANRFNAFLDEIERFSSELSNEVRTRREAEGQLRIFKLAFQSVTDGVCISDPDGRARIVNPAFTRITGYDLAEIVDQAIEFQLDFLADGVSPDIVRRAVGEHRQWSGEALWRRKEGGTFPAWLSVSPIRDETGKVTHYVFVLRDISEMRQKEDQIRFLAYHDALTRLPNRILLLDRLEHALSAAKRANLRVAVLFLDLDNFKNVNDSLGHAAGDRLLMGVVTRIETMVRECDTVARIGGDEFVIVAESLADEREATSLARRILERLEAPFEVEGQELYVSVSIGITLFPEDGQTPSDLIRNADMAMFRAKDQGKNRYQMFAAEMNERATRRLQIEADLRRALDRDEIQVHFQPRVALDNGRIVSVEALARWTREDGVRMSPAEFIPVAEETGLVLQLGETVLRKAAAAIKSFNADGHAIGLSVNLSAKQFLQQGLPEIVDNVLSETGFPPERLEFEITETTIMRDVDVSLGNLQALAERGIRLSIDDFGTGYSSLSYLKRFPINVLKIDRRFIKDLPNDISDAILVETIILMGRNFHMEIVAEGVETRPQLEFLRARGCHQIQGYLFSPPVSEVELAALLELRLDHG